MSFSNFGNLKAAIASFADRTDKTSQIPDYITLATTRILYGSTEPPYASEPLRIRFMETSATLTFNAQQVALPAGYLQMRRLMITGDSGGKLNLISPDQFWLKYTVSQSGRPIEYAIEGENILLGPSPDATYTGKMLYYKAFDTLEETEDTNWLLENAPGVYLQGALIELWDDLKDYEAKAEAHKAFVGLVNSLNKADQADRWSGSPWVGKPDVYTP